MNTTKLSKNQQIELIKECWNRIDYCFSSISWGQYGKQYLAINLSEEKDHDRFRGNDITRGISISLAAKLFCVKQIVEYLSGEKPPKPEEYIDYRKSIFFAYSIASKYRKELEKALENISYVDVLALDYCELIK